MASEEGFPVFEEDLWDPLSYLQPSSELRTKCLSAVKLAFDFYKRQTGRLSLEVPTGPLEELYVDEFDSEQVWAEIELLNEPALRSLKKHVKKAAAWKLDTQAAVPTPSPHAHATPTPLEGGDPVDSGTNSDGELEDSEGEGSDEHVGKRPRERGRSSVVDDRFFKLAEMERFLEHTERQEGDVGEDVSGSEEDEDIDYFSAPMSDSQIGTGSTERPHYTDFFDSPEPTEGDGSDPGELGDHGELDDGSEASDEASEAGEESGVGGEGSDAGDESGVGGEGSDAGEESGVGGEGSDAGEESGVGGGDSESDSEDKKEPLSTHEKRQMKISQKIAELEAVNLAPRSWQLAGETTAKDRPLNSLLAEDLSFDHTSRPAPVITEETTKTLEDIIKQRIIDEAWDDVERKIKPAEKPYDYSRSRPLDQTKSKQSLAEVYEQEYLKQTRAEEETKEDERHTEIKELMKKLFVKLDALSNFHFTPKPPKPDVTIVANVPAIQMEEVAPVAISDASRLAPEEVQSKSVRPEVGATEKSDTDRRRDRRLKKRRKRIQIAERKQREKVVSKLRPGLGNKFSRKAMEKKLKEREQEELVDRSLKSSSRFFAKLQEQVKEEVKGVKKGRGERKMRTVSGHQYKL